MRYKLPLIFLLVFTMNVMAQFSPPDIVRSPAMVFDQYLSNKTQPKDINFLPISFSIDDHKVTIGKTTISQVIEFFGAKKPLYDGEGYYLCYSLPKYNHQIWFVSKNAELNAPISEIAVKLGDTLPIDYCPVISSNTYPKFTDKIRLEANPEYLVPALGRPLSKERITDVYLYQLSASEKLKVQISRGRKGVEAIKVTQQN